MALAIVSPITQYFDLDGDPLDAGKLYFGDVNQNPLTNPVTVYWDAAGTIPAAQPVRTVNGYTTRNGTAAPLYAAADFSILVQDRKGRQVVYAANSAEFSNSANVLAALNAYIASLANNTNPALGDALVGHYDPVAPAFLKTTSDILNGVPVSILRFIQKTAWADIAAGTSTLDVSANYNTAANAAKRLEINRGKYRLNSKVTIPQDVQWRGFNKQNTILEFVGAAGLEAVAGGGGAYDIVISGVYLKGDNSGANRHGLHLDGTASNYGRVSLEDLVISSFSGDGLRLTRPIVSTLRNIQSSLNGGHGFDYIGDGTSLTSIGLYAFQNTGDGHHIEGNIQYSTWIGCAADHNTGHQYNFNGSVATPAQGIVLIGCGAESSNGGDYFKFTATQGLTLEGVFVYPGAPATGGHFIHLDGVRRAFLSGIRMATAPAGGNFALKIGNMGGAQFPAGIRSAGCEFVSVDDGGFRAYVDLNSAYNPLTLKSGVTGAITNGTIVTHDLGVAPTNVWVTTGDSTLICDADTFTTTTFRLLVQDNAGGFPAARAYRWTAIA